MAVGDRRAGLSLFQNLLIHKGFSCFSICLGFTENDKKKTQLMNRNFVSGNPLLMKKIVERLTRVVQADRKATEAETFTLYNGRIKMLYCRRLSTSTVSVGITIH